MAGDGPTTAGSITGKLKLDTSDWDAKIAAADAAARKLGSADPTIRVDVDSAHALEQLAVVDAASKKLGASQSSLTDSTNSLNQANGNGIQRWQMIAALIVALIPLFEPLLGAVVGLAGAFAGLGAAGVLGVVGIVQAMKQGTAVGAQYSAGLKELKSDLDQVAGTAATTLLQSFNTAVTTINDSMPFLNGQIGWFSSELGAIGNSALRSVINGLQILNPLFIQATNYVKSLVTGFESWTSNGGLQKFASYAESTFPTVTRALGALVGAAFNLVDALAPVGVVMLNIVTAAASVIQWLTSMGPIFGVIAGGAAAAFGAFKLWALVGPILSDVLTAVEAATGGFTAMGIAVDAASGPIGWVVAGIGALVAVLGISASATQQNTQAADSYTAALQQSNGALDENVRKQVAKNLSDAGLLATAKQYHLQLSTVTDAVLGNKDAMDQVTEATNKYGKTMVDVHGQDGAVTNSYTALSDKGREFLATVNGQTGSLKDSVQAFRDQQNAAKNSGVSVDNLKDAEDAAKTATDKFSQALSGLGNVNLSAAQANIQYQQSLADMNTAVLKNGHTLDLSTQAGRDNMSALDGIASSAVSLIAAEAKQGTSETDLQANMAASRASFVAAAEAAGATADQANNLADQYGLIPADVSTAYHTSGADDAVQKANAVAAAVAAIQTSITVRVNAIMTNSTNANIGFGLGDGHAAGGKIGKGLAGGGYSGAVSGPGNAFNDLAGLYPLSDGEFVVSNQFRQAQQFMPALSAMNAGASALTVASKVLGGSGMSIGRSGGTVHNHYVTNHFTVLANDPTELTQKVSMRQNRLGVV